MTNPRSKPLGELVKKYRTDQDMTQEAVAHLLTQRLGREIRQNIIGYHERGERWTSEDLIGAYREVLHIPIAEMIEAATGLTDPGAPPPPPTFEEMVRADRSLSKAAKEHLINQYGLLQLASKNSPASADDDESPPDAEAL